jgi:hypothetical protein
MTGRSGRIASSSRVSDANNRAVSQPGPSRSTSEGKYGVCGTPKAPTISATANSFGVASTHRGRYAVTLGGAVASQEIARLAILLAGR